MTRCPVAKLGLDHEQSLADRARVAALRFADGSRSVRRGWRDRSSVATRAPRGGPRVAARAQAQLPMIGRVTQPLRRGGPRRRRPRGDCSSGLQPRHRLRTIDGCLPCDSAVQIGPRPGAATLEAATSPPCYDVVALGAMGRPQARPAAGYVGVGGWRQVQRRVGVARSSLSRWVKRPCPCPNPDERGVVQKGDLVQLVGRRSLRTGTSAPAPGRWSFARPRRPSDPPQRADAPLCTPSCGQKSSVACETAEGLRCAPPST